jgi:hypothetical protein
MGTPISENVQKGSKWDSVHNKIYMVRTSETNAIQVPFQNEIILKSRKVSKTSI